MPAPRSERNDATRREPIRLKRLAHLGVLDIACDDGQRTLVLTGELDRASFWMLDCPLRQIGARGSTTFTLDLSGLTSIDSAGVRAVLAARGLCATRRCEFTLIPGPAHVQRVLELGGLIDDLRLGKQEARGMEP